MYAFMNEVWKNNHNRSSDAPHLNSHPKSKIVTDICPKFSELAINTESIDNNFKIYQNNKRNHREYPIQNDNYYRYQKEIENLINYKILERFEHLGIDKNRNPPGYDNKITSNKDMLLIAIGVLIVLLLVIIIVKLIK